MEVVHTMTPEAIVGEEQSKESVIAEHFFGDASAGSSLGPREPSTAKGDSFSVTVLAFVHRSILAGWWGAAFSLRTKGRSCTAE